MDLSVKTLFQQECVERGLITLGCHNVSFSHSDHYVEKILAIYDETISVITDILKKGDDISNYLKGPSIEAVFK
jgi:glutamate-1-semialdehyde 2,1-aminomutase